MNEYYPKLWDAYPIYITIGLLLTVDKGRLQLIAPWVVGITAFIIKLSYLLQLEYRFTPMERLAWKPRTMDQLGHSSG